MDLNIAERFHHNIFYRIRMHNKHHGSGSNYLLHSLVHQVRCSPVRSIGNQGSRTLLQDVSSSHLLIVGTI